ncbi:PF03932 family protein CutC isoform X1 [Amblyomma americanum]
MVLFCVFIFLEPLAETCTASAAIEYRVVIAPRGTAALCDGGRDNWSGRRALSSLDQLALPETWSINSRRVMAVELEVCVDSVASALTAAECGATRLELCAGLAVGGLTPTLGTFLAVRQRVAVPIMVLVRPRAGDFCYTAEEVEAMATDIALFRQNGVHGFVIGALTREGDVDVATCQHLLAAAGPQADTTFHRAFDVVRNPEAALERVIELGFRRLLTSGQAASVELGLDLLCRLATQAKGRIQLMPGGGVSESNLAHLLHATGVRAIHASASEPAPAAMSALSFGEHRMCSAARVRALSVIIRSQGQL